MISDDEAAVLRAEVIALQAVMMAVFRRFAEHRPETVPLFCQAFDEAETILQGVADGLGRTVPLQSTLDALRVIEELRAAVIHDEGSCVPRE